MSVDPFSVKPLPIRLFHRGLAGLLVAMLLPLCAMAQGNFPNRPVKIVAATTAGNSVDIAARITAEKMSKQVGQQFIVENRAGGSGLIGISQVARTPADGYTLVFSSTGPFAVVPNFKPDQAVDIMKNFEPVALVSSFAQFFIAAPGFGAKDMKSFVAKVKAAPGKFNYAHPGLGQTQHIAQAAFVDLLGLNLVAVPFPGSTPALRDVMADRAALGMGGATSIKGTNLVPLAVLSAKRIDSMPDVPTMAEAGYPEFMKLASWLSWNAVLAPAGTPRAVVTSLNGFYNNGLRDPEVNKRLEELGQENWAGSTPESAREFIAREVTAWAAVIKKLGVKAD